MTSKQTSYLLAVGLFGIWLSAVGLSCAPVGDGSGPDGTTDGNGTNGGGAGGMLAGQVSSLDGEPIAGVAVSLSTGLSATTDDHGFYSFTALTPGDTVVATFRKEGFATTAKAFTVQSSSDATVGCVIMAEAAPPVLFDADATSTQRSGDSAVTIEGGTLVDAEGNPVSGEVELTATFFDSSGDGVMAFPGGFESAQGTDGSPVTLESFGFAIYEATQNGEPVNLAPGATAVIEYVLPDNAQDDFDVGDTIPLWEFDEATAIWTEAGEGEVGEASDGSGRLAWFAEVDHFSAWNCDAPVDEKHCIAGRVVSNGSSVTGALITAVGIDYNGTSTAHTGSDGTFCVDVKRGSLVQIEVRLNGSATAIATREVTVPDVSASCQTGGCLNIEDISVALDACIMGRVLDEDGNGQAGVTVYVVPGEAVQTGADGSFCARAPSSSDVFVFAENRPSIQVTTFTAGTCGEGACASADLSLTLPEDGDTVGSLQAGKHVTINAIPGFGSFESASFTLAGSFFIASPEVGDEFSFGGVTTEIDEVAGCTVTTMMSTFTVSEDFDFGDGFLTGIGALDPGSPGQARNNGISVELLPGDPTMFDPPLPFVAGLYSPELSGEELLALGFDAGQTITFEFPGGADIGAFTASAEVPDELVITSPDLTDPVLTIGAGSPLTVTWIPGDPADSVKVSLSTVNSIQTQNPDGTFTVTSTNVIVLCPFADSGSGTVPAEATSLLLVGGDITILTASRTHETEVIVPLNRVGGNGIVQVIGSAGITRSLFSFPDFEFPDFDIPDIEFPEVP